MGLGEPSVLLIGTLDTKGPEVDYLRSRLHALGVPTLVMDTGILGEPLHKCLPTVINGLQHGLLR